MNAKPGMLSYLFCSLLFSDICIAENGALSSAEKIPEVNSSDKKLSESIPKISNETEYMEFIRKRDSANSVGAVKSSSSSSASSRRAQETKK